MISAIVLAAGLSTRMGQTKGLLDWQGVPLVCYQVEQLRAAGVDDVVVVLGHRMDDLHRAIRNHRCRVMVNTRYYLGRAGSLRLGARAVERDTDAVIVVNVDQPRTAGFFRALIAGHDPSRAATRPVVDGRRGHPVILSGRLRGEMLEVTEEGEGLRAILRAHSAEVGEVAIDGSATLDLNTPEEYQAARAEIGRASCRERVYVLV